jgi:hypothetical protein
MKTITSLAVALLLSTPLLSSAQSFPQFPAGPDFLDSRATAAVYAMSFDDVRHIVYSGDRITGLSAYYYIDQGYIGGDEYKYYISRDGSLVIAVPLSFPNNYYVISICAYKEQGGWASSEYIRSQQERCNCW